MTVGPTKAMKKNARKKPGNSVTKTQLQLWEEKGYADGLANHGPHTPTLAEYLGATILVKIADAYKAGWWRGFSEYSKGRART